MKTLAKMLTIAIVASFYILLAGQAKLDAAQKIETEAHITPMVTQTQNTLPYQENANKLSEEEIKNLQITLQALFANTNQPDPNISQNLIPNMSDKKTQQTYNAMFMMVTNIYLRMVNFCKSIKNTATNPKLLIKRVLFVSLVSMFFWNFDSFNPLTYFNSPDFSTFLKGTWSIVCVCFGLIYWALTMAGLLGDNQELGMGALFLGGLNSFVYKTSGLSQIVGNTANLIINSTTQRITTLNPLFKALHTLLFNPASATSTIVKILQFVAYLCLTVPKQIFLFMLKNFVIIPKLVGTFIGEGKIIDIRSFLDKSEHVSNSFIDVIFSTKTKPTVQTN